MPDVMDLFGHLNGFDMTQLYARRTEIIGTAPNGDFKKLKDDQLQELLAIARILRKRAAPPSAIKGGKKAPAPSLDAL